MNWTKNLSKILLPRYRPAALSPASGKHVRGLGRTETRTATTTHRIMPRRWRTCAYPPSSWPVWGGWLRCCPAAHGCSSNA